MTDALEYLDQLDGDPDLEPTNGWQPYPDECEGPDDDLEPDADGEPDLGSPKVPAEYIARRSRGWQALSGNQTRWATGGGDDREGDASDEAEEDPAESGIGDQQGLDEQIGCNSSRAGGNLDGANYGWSSKNSAIGRFRQILHWISRKRPLH